MFRILLLSLFLVVVKPYAYVFHKDRNGETECSAIKKHFENDAEEFRLWCINEETAIKRCGISCHDALHFRPSIASCQKPKCDFSSHKFEKEDGSSLQVADDKIVMFAIVPTLPSYGNYVLSMLEAIKTYYPEESTEALYLPLDIAIPGEFDPEKCTLVRNEAPMVHVLKEKEYRFFAEHEFYKFLITLRSSDKIDIFTDRPVVFVIKGKQVERHVFPSLETLEGVLAKFGAQKVSMRGLQVEGEL